MQGLTGFGDAIVARMLSCREGKAQSEFDSRSNPSQERVHKPCSSCSINPVSPCSGRQRHNAVRLPDVGPAR